MIKFDVTNRFTGEAQFTAEIDCDEDAPRSVKLGLAVQWGYYKNAAYLARANLADAYLADANLARAYLVGANLAGADLVGANLAGADLADANLADANLADADLAGATYNGLPCTQPPIQTWCGLKYPVTILDQHICIGCELHSIEDWSHFDDRRILEMDGKAALEWWLQWKEPILSMVKASGRPFPQEQKEAD